MPGFAVASVSSDKLIASRAVQTPCIAQCIEHTLLRPSATSEAFDRLVEEAITHKLFGVCVPSGWVRHCCERAKGRSLSIVSVAGFPLGTEAASVKAKEVESARVDGASEFDVVIHRGFLKEGNHQAVLGELQAVVSAAEGRVVKVILETGDLDRGEMETACELVKEAGAQFVKTSTGFGFGGATEADVATLASIAGSDIRVKASGGIRDREQAIRLLAAGAHRLGTSASLQLVGSSAPPGGTADTREGRVG